MNLTELKELFSETTVFSILTDAELTEFAGRAELAHYALGQLVCRAGEEISAFSMVYSGRARVVAENAQGEEITVGTLTRGSVFGEQGLLADARNDYTVRAASDLALLRLSKEDFAQLLDARPELRGYFDYYASETSIRYFLPRSYPAGYHIYRAGAPGDALYILRDGSVRIAEERQLNRTINHINPGETFGLTAMLTGGPRSTSAVTKEASSVFRLEKRDFDQLIASSPTFKEALTNLAAGYNETGVRATARLPQLSTMLTGALTLPTGALTDPTSRVTAPLQLPPAPELNGSNGYHPAHARRYPALLQLSETDCGADCLAMILRYYRKQVSINRLRELVNVGRDGASLYSVAEGAEALGFHARGIRASYELLAKINLPAIVHWEGFHYIVLYEVKPEHVIVADPASGLRKLPRAEFEKGWTGYALLLQPTPRLDEVEESKTTFGRFLPLLKPYWRLLFEIFLASLLLQLFGLASPIFTQVVVDRALVHKSISLLNLMLIGMLLITVFQTATSALRYYLLVHTTRRIDMQMVVDFYRHILSLPLGYFEQRKTGDIIKRFSDNARIREFLTGRALGVVLDCLMVFVYLALMCYYNVQLTLIALLFIPGYIALTLVLTPKLRRQHRETFEKEAAADSQMVESITGVGTVKATATERKIRWKLEGLMVGALNVQFRNAMLAVTTVSCSNILQTLNTLVLFWYGAHLVIDGRLSVGQLVAFNVLVGNVTRPILSVIELWNEFQHVNIALERLNEVFEAKPEEEANKPSLIHLPPMRGHIRFENVTFRYPSRGERNALQNITLEIAPGQTVALVGRSGAGKSTFANLLLRLHEPNEGKIYIDGHDMRQLSISSLRGQVGVVPQEVFLFSGTIRENIAFGDADARLQEVVGASMLAGAHEFISELPLGYETKIGERGQSLSGGQKQRIAIARALFKKPRILIFDEATSALDTESERAIQQNLDKILKDRTTFVIAHRLSTVRNADLIVVLDRGAVVETGTHYSLMEQRGMYYYLNSQQLES